MISDIKSELLPLLEEPGYVEEDSVTELGKLMLAGLITALEDQDRLDLIEHLVRKYCVVALNETPR